jgi:hypothetical protein
LVGVGCEGSKLRFWRPVLFSTKPVVGKKKRSLFYFVLVPKATLSVPKKSEISLDKLRFVLFFCLSKKSKIFLKPFPNLRLGSGRREKKERNGKNVSTKKEKRKKKEEKKKEFKKSTIFLTE